MGHSRREPLAVDWAMRLSKRPRARMTRGGFRERGGEASSSRRMTRKIAGRDLPARNNILQGSARRITPRRLEGGPKRWLANIAGGRRDARRARAETGEGRKRKRALWTRERQPWHRRQAEGRNRRRRNDRTAGVNLTILHQAPDKERLLQHRICKSCR